MSTQLPTGYSPDSLSFTERIFGPMEEIKRRLSRAVQALESAKVPYAIIGGFAVAAHVTRLNPAAVRFTRDVDLLLDRNDLESAKAALAKAGFVYRHASGVDMFLEGPGGKAGDAIHVLFAGEFVRPEYLAPVPQISEAEPDKNYRVLNLEALVRMKLTSFRRKDQTHLDDLIELGLVDATWPARFPPELASRLQQLLDDPQPGLGRTLE